MPAFVFALVASLAFAQFTGETKQGFAAGLIQFMEALPGTYGDEGARVASGIEAMDRGLGRWDAMLRTYESAMASEIQGAPPPTAALMHISMGAVYLERSRTEDALREFAAAGQLAPQRADVHVFRGLAFEAANKSVDAAESYRLAWVRDRSDPVKAYLFVRHVPKISQSPDAQQALQTLLASQRQQQAAQGPSRASPFTRIALLEEAAPTDPVFPPALYADGFALLRQGQFEQAVVRFREAAAADPLILDPALRSEPVTQGIAALRNGKVALALLRLRAAVDMFPDSSEAHRILGTAYWFDEQYASSVEQLAAAVRLNPRSERARIGLSDVLSDAEQSTKAGDVLRDAIRAIPNSGQAHWKLGQIYGTLFRESDALLEFEQATAFGPVGGASRLHEAVGRLYFRHIDVDGAIKADRRWISADPNNAEAHKALGTDYRKQDSPDEALAEFVAALLIDPQDADAYAAIGQIHLGAARYGDAVDALQRAVALKPRHKEARYALARALMGFGKAADGARELDVFQRLQAEAMEETRRYYEVYELKREAARDAEGGQYDQSAARWQQIIDREPDVASNEVSLAQSLAKAGRHEAAIEHFVRALGLNAGPQVHRNLAEEYAALGRLEDSEKERATFERLQEERLRMLGTVR